MTTAMASTVRRIAAGLGLVLAVMAFNASGAAAAPGATCGGFIGPILCSKGEFCQVATGQCTGLMPGVCTTRPKACIKIYRPVCGCDNKTYSNDCMRMQAGVSKLHDGRCKKKT